jgi:hypothetical protein
VPLIAAQSVELYAPDDTRPSERALVSWSALTQFFASASAGSDTTGQYAASAVHHQPASGTGLAREIANLLAQVDHLCGQVTVRYRAQGPRVELAFAGSMTGTRSLWLSAVTGRSVRWWTAS